MVRSVSAGRSALATPKSITLATGLPSLERDQHVRRLDVAVNDPLLMRHAGSPGRPGRTDPDVRWVVSRLRSQYSVIGTPLTSSMTKYGRPLSVAPASSTLAMFGWSIMASA